MAVQIVPVRRTQQERREKAEARLLTAAAGLIGAQGTQSTSLAQVGEKAGYSRGIVHHHFGSKAALLERLALWVQEGFRAQVIGGVPPRRGLEAILTLADAYLAALAPLNIYGRALFVMWAEAAAGSRELRPTMAQSDRRFRQMVRGALAEGVEEGTVRADVDPSAFAAALVGQLRGVALQLLINKQALDVTRVRAETATWLRKALTP